MNAATVHPSRSLPPAYFSQQVVNARRFYLNLDPPRTAALAVVSGGCEFCSPDYRVRRSTFPFYSIEYVLRGRGRLKLAGRARELQPGSIFSYGPGIPHDIIADPSDPPVKYFIDFSGRQSKGLLQRSRLPPGSVLQVFPPYEIQNLFDELIHCGQQNPRPESPLCRGLLECIALKIREARLSQRDLDTLAFSTYRNCRRHIENHFGRLKTLAEIAQACHLDAAYLCRLFARYDRQSPYQFLMRLKMNQAAEWLQQPGILVKQVSERAGFRDPFHFSRAFKKVFGIAPETFRRLR